jgi:putative SbcD/Mre11-related phosphoesterase
MTETMQDWVFTPERVAIHVPTATAVVADLHLGYDDARRWSGEAVPATSLQELLSPLRTVRRRNSVRRIVIAGDLLEKRLPDSLIDSFLRTLRIFGLEFAGVVPGNHDRRLDSTAVPIHPDGFLLGEWLVIHGDRPVKAERVVQGHWHPCLRLSGGQRAPCYLVRDGHIILPAFSADAAGSNVFAQLQWNDYACHVCAAEKVRDFGTLRELRRKLRRHSCNGSG